jgi:hypothetical protein
MRVAAARRVVDLAFSATDKDVVKVRDFDTPLVGGRETALVRGHPSARARMGDFPLETKLEYALPLVCQIKSPTGRNFSAARSIS